MIQMTLVNMFGILYDLPAIALPSEREPKQAS